MNRTDRLLAILLELQARGEVRAEDLAQHFEVAVRTIYRDLDALGESGVPIVATPGKGYRLQEGYFLPPLHFTATEAALLALGGSVLRKRLGGDEELERAAGDALAKLESALPADKRADVERWRRELLFPTLSGSDSVGSTTLARLRRAIRDRRVIRLEYQAFREPRATSREVEPTALVHLGESWNLAGYCRLRQATRLFRLDRIDRLDLLPEHYAWDPMRHDVRAPEEAWRTQAPEAKVRFDGEAERWVRERQPFTFLREEIDSQGSIFVYALRAGAKEERGLIAWLLNWGSAVEVLSPPELRTRLADEALAVAMRHANETNLGQSGKTPRAPDRTVSGARAHAGAGA